MTAPVCSWYGQTRRGFERGGLGSPHVWPTAPGRGWHFLGGGHIDDTDRAALMGDLLNEPPSLPGVQVEVTVFEIAANQDSMDGIVKFVGQD